MVPGSIYLHGFGTRFDLPIPLVLYLTGAALVVALSFVLVAVFAGRRLGEDAVRYPRWPAPLLTWLANSSLVRGLGGIIGVLGLLAVVVTGLAGSQEPSRSPAEFLTWIYFWAGLLLLTGVVGNLWALLNPWTAIYDSVGRFVRRPAPQPLPARFGIWPALAFFFLFACLELTSGVANRPWLLATLAVLYSIVTLTGMVIFGRDPWLQRCEAFSVVLGVIGRFAPVEAQRSGDGRGLQVFWRPWGVGLLQPQRAGWDWILLVILMLSTLAFDGILATPLWKEFFLRAVGAVRPVLGSLSFAVIRTLAMIGLTAVFAAAFTLTMRLVLLFGSRKVDSLATMTAFTFTLVPIALVYNAAHNYTYLVVQAQGLIPLLADPLGRGWKLLPTADYVPSFVLAGAALVWYMQVILIVIGHVIAVYLSHLRAGERYRRAANILFSQYPMLVLMILYTMTSLWILAQPITREAA